MLRVVLLCVVCCVLRVVCFFCCGRLRVRYLSLGVCWLRCVVCCMVAVVGCALFVDCCSLFGVCRSLCVVY